MSNFIKGNTYQLSDICQIALAITMQAKFAGEAGVFTVAEVNEDGTIFTDDITSPRTTERCKIPAELINDVILIKVGGEENKQDIVPPVTAVLGG